MVECIHKVDKDLQACINRMMPGDARLVRHFASLIVYQN